MNHTKHPWRIDGTGYRIESVHPRRGMMPAGDPFPHVASVRAPSRDARLIAAAPDLYHAANAALDVLLDMYLDAAGIAAMQKLATALDRAEKGDPQ